MIWVADSDQEIRPYNLVSKVTALDVRVSKFKTFFDQWNLWFLIKSL